MFFTFPLGFYCMIKKILSLFSVLFVILNILSLCGCSDKRQKYTDYSFDCFDTVTTIVGFEENEAEFKANCKLIKEKLYFYHQLYDIYTKYDGVKNLCVLNETKKAVVPDEIIKLLEFSRDMYDKTGGKVNIAMGSVLSLWHNYREEGLDNPSAAKLPDMNTLKNAAGHTDINNIIIDYKNNTVSLSDENTSLDVGAVAKGYAVQAVADWMRKVGYSGYLLNVGGNVCTVGDRPDGEKWTVGVENPDTENTKEPYIAYLELDGGKALVTSGSYQRYYTVDGKNYHHIINSDTLMPAEYFKSVTVLCEDSGKADALSTALFCMSYQDGSKIISDIKDTEAMWVFPDGKIKYSEKIKDYFAEK